jgi:PGF-CTERM protein
MVQEKGKKETTSLKDKKLWIAVGGVFIVAIFFSNHLLGGHLLQFLGGIVAPPPKLPSPLQPGFGAIVALIGLGAVAWLVIRENR